MRQFLVGLTALFLLVSAAAAQTPDGRQDQPPAPQQVPPNTPEQPSQPAQTQAPAEQVQPPASASRQVTLPAGTRVLLQLQSPIYTKTARVGDGVYCESTFPVTQENQMAIPAGTYVKGRITHIQRPGRVKGRAELQVHFTSMIFPNGYTVDLPGTLEGTPGSYNHQVTDDEGTVKANGTKGRDVGTVASTTGAGAVIGGVASRSGTGAGIGAGVGAAVGLAQVLLTRGPDVRLERGTALEMVLQTPLTVDVPRDYENYQSRRNFMPPSDVRPRPVRRRRMGGYGYPMPPPPAN
jgi:hypothetical protein